MRIVAFVVSSLVLIGCSSAPEKPDPTRLERITPEVVLVKQGSASLGGDDVTGLTPVITASGLVAASSRGEVSLLTLPDLDEVWSTDLDQDITAGVGANDASVFVITANGRLIALSLVTGEVQFERVLPSAVTTVPSADDDRVYVKTQVGRLMALSAATGETLWVEEAQETTIGIRGGAPMTLSNNTLWVLWESGRLAGYQADNGRIVFERQVAVSKGRSPLERIVDSKGAPSIQNSVLATATRNGQLSVLDIGSGQPLWSVDADAYPGALVGFNAVTVVETDGTVSAYSLQTGESLWSTQALRYRELSAPSVFANSIVVVDLEGVVHLIDPADGGLVGRLDVGSAKGLVAPVVSSEGMAVQLVDGRVTWVSVTP